jgi:ribonucleoside-diphosphate reductase beta chain
MKQKKLFNPDAKEVLTMINGDTTNLLNLADIPKDYEIYHKLVDTAYGNNWLPHKVSMSEDVSDYKNKLTPEEIEGYDDIISFLAFLDSLQTNNIPNMMAYITNPHVVYFGARQTYDEAIHSKSYGWILSSLMSKEKANSLYYKWKENSTLLERNKFIAEIYQTFVDEPTTYNFLRAIVANYILEGIYFYNGFQFFHNLAMRGLMIGTDTQIAYIQRDELVHCLAYENILVQMFKEDQSLLKETDMILEMFKEAVAWEIKFSVETIGDKVLGMTTQSIIDNTHFLANKRLKAIGLEQIFPKAKNPYTHLDKLAGSDDETSNRTNNFEGTSISYKSPEVIDGWDEI